MTAQELKELIKEYISRTGASCIWTTHDLHNIPPEIKRVVLLQKGRVLFDGNINEGLSRPWLIRAGLAVPQSGEESC